MRDGKRMREITHPAGHQSPLDPHHVVVLHTSEAGESEMRDSPATPACQTHKQLCSEIT